MKKFIKKLKGWKTMIFATLLSVGGVIQNFNLAQILQPQYAGWALLVIGILVAVLRMLTTTSVGEKI